MKRLIYNVFYSKEGQTKAPNIHNSRLSTYNMYIRNSFVSLCSAKEKNPGCSVILFTNCKLPEQYSELFDKNNIDIVLIPFDEYQMPDFFKWGYAFYKLCVLKHIVLEMEYDCILGLDTDTVVTGSLELLWEEMLKTNSVMLYNLHRKLDHPVMKAINRDYGKLFGKHKIIQQFGGEFVAGGGKCLQDFIGRVDEVYYKVKDDNFKMIDSDSGDEAFLSMAAANFNAIRDANAYIGRFWTGRFYLVSTSWKYDPVDILHLPAEKSYGMLDIYDYFKNHNRMPEIGYIAKVCSLPKEHPTSISVLKKFLTNILK